MGRELIKRENFEIAKSNIEQFAKNLPSNPSFNRVEIDGGLFGWGNHKVTGCELNRFIGAVQNKLIDINTSLRSTISEFKEVYATFEVLDKEYISGIIATAEEAERAGNIALQAQKDTQKTVDKLVDNLYETVKQLASLKGRIDNIEETILQKSQTTLLSYFDIVKKLENSYKISQIPAINNTIRLIQDSNTSLHETLSTTLREVNEINNQVNFLTDNANKIEKRVNSEIASLQSYRSVLEKYKHLGDVDSIWSDIESHKANLRNFHEQVDNFINNVNKTTERIFSDINSLQSYRSVLEKYKHLGDVDSIWNDVESHKADLKSFHEQVDAFISEVHSTESEIKDSIRKMQEANSSAHLLYEKRIKIAYGLGGTGIVVSIINLILQMVGVL